MRNKLFLLIFLVFGPYYFGQSVDSLLLVSTKAKHDTTKYNALISLGELHLYSNPDSSRLFFRKVLRLSESKIRNGLSKKVRERFILNVAYSTYCLGLMDLNASFLDESKKKFEKAQKEYEKIDNKEGIGNCLNNIGYIYYNRGDITKTLLYYKKAISLYLKINYYDGLIASYVNTAAIYNDQEDFRLALELNRKALILSKKIKNDSYIAVCSINLALIYLNHPEANCPENDPKCIEESQNKALYLFNEGYKLNEKIGDRHTNASVLNNLGLLYSKRNQVDKAKSLYEQAEKLAIESQNKRTLAYIKFNLSEVFYKQGDIQKAQRFAEESMALAEETAYPDVIKNSSNVLKKIYTKQKKYKEALEMTNLFNTMKDSISREVNKKSTVKKQLEISFEKRAFADSLRSEKQKAIVQLKLEKKESQQKYLFLILILSLVSAALIYNRFRINRKQKEVIEQKNKELERFNALNQKIFSVISHDFKGPITTLRSLLTKNELISDENPLVSMYIKDINTQLTQSDQMLESLLDWAKAELSLTYSENTSLVLPVVNQVLSQLDIQIKQKNLKINVEVGEEEKLDLPQDVLKIVLRNLLSNAIKFSHDGKSIVIRLTGKELQVIDEGKGIDAKKMETLFTKQVASGLGTNHETGFGLGLYMCNELLNKNKAFLKVSGNKDGIGSTFTLSFA